MQSSVLQLPHTASLLHQADCCGPPALLRQYHPDLIILTSVIGRNSTAYCFYLPWLLDRLKLIAILEWPRLCGHLGETYSIPVARLH